MDDFHDEQQRRDEPEGRRDPQAHERALGCQESYDLPGRCALGKRNNYFCQLSLIFQIVIHTFLDTIRAALRTNSTWNNLFKYIKINQQPLLERKK